MFLEYSSASPTPEDVPASCRVYTPCDLALAMVVALGDQPGVRWLEPSHGQGVFLEALAKVNVEKDRIVAIDLDAVPADCDRYGNVTRGVDFLSWAARSRLRFDRIIGNPPYVALNQLPPQIKKRAAAIKSFNGDSIGQNGNLWHAFVLSSLRLLKKGGALAFVLPSAANYANYAADIREYVVRSFGEVDIFIGRRPLFDQVQDGTIVIVARNHLGGPASVKRRSFASREAVVKALSDRRAKRGRRCRKRYPPQALQTVKLGAIAKLRLGGVTGHAAYFLMNEEKRLDRRLPTRAFRKVVSRARHLRSAALTDSAWNKLRLDGERVWLFRPSECLITHPSVAAYLQLEVKDGGCKRSAYKVRARNPWYRTPLPTAPHAFISGMSQSIPWICINEAGCVNATNTLYVLSFSREQFKDRYRWALALLTSYAQRQLRRVGRRYPEGLIKYEPSEIQNVQLPQMRCQSECKRLYKVAMRELLIGNIKTAIEMADSAILAP